MAFENVSSIDIADLMIGRIQSLCQQLRNEGFPTAADELEDTCIRLHDRILLVLSAGERNKIELEQLANEILASIEKVEKITELVSFRDRILKVFNGQS